jgi:ferredoxin-NADP reductase
MTVAPSGAESVRELVVVERAVVASEVVTLTLATADGSPLPGWEPGAHIDVFLDEFVRQYSLCGQPSDRGTWRLGILREASSRGGTKRVHESIHVGDRLTVRGPRNHFPLVPARRYIFLAGGIGITPILPMVAAAADAEADWHLHYGGRARTSMAFLDELGKYGDRVTIWPADERGLLPLKDLLHDPTSETLVYSCGPEGLLSAVEERCSRWPSGSLHVERFAPKAETDFPRAPGFEVECRRSALTVAVAADQSILDALERVGLSVVSSCQEGICGSCETRVLAGEPEHRDSVLSDEEQAANATMMICVGRSRTPRLVLDL